MQMRLVVSTYRSLWLTFLGAAGVSCGNICARAAAVWYLRRRATMLPPRTQYAFAATQHLLLQSLPVRQKQVRCTLLSLPCPSMCANPRFGPDERRGNFAVLR